MRNAPGIYRRGNRLEVRATAGGVTESASFPLDTPLRTMKSWQEDHRSAIRRKHPVAASGTLDADAQTYLALPSVKAQAGFSNTEHHILWWVERLGHKRRAAITPDDIRAGHEALITQGLTPGTRRGYLASLASLWSKLDGRSHYCPVRDIDQPHIGPLPVRSIPPDDLAKILDALPRPYSKTSARILVFATTGFSSSMQQRIDPQQVDVGAATVTMPPRRKGSGVSGRVLPLTRAAADAFTIWLAVGASGHFRNDVLARAFKDACRKAKVKTYRLYDLRHSFITEAVKALGPVGAMGLAMHSTITTTMRYANGAVQPQMQATVDALNLAQRSGEWQKTQQIH